MLFTSAKSVCIFSFRVIFYIPKSFFFGSNRTFDFLARSQSISACQKVWQDLLWKGCNSTFIMLKNWGLNADRSSAKIPRSCLKFSKQSFDWIMPKQGSSDLNLFGPNDCYCLVIAIVFGDIRYKILKDSFLEDFRFF